MKWNYSSQKMAAFLLSAWNVELVDVLLRFESECEKKFHLLTSVERNNNRDIVCVWRWIVFFCGSFAIHSRKVGSCFGVGVFDGGKSQALLFITRYMLFRVVAKLDLNADAYF